MIAYNLVCTGGHEFEAWFKDSATYDAQEANGELVCPFCGSGRITKGVMAPAVKTSVTKHKGRSAAVSEKLRQYVAGYRKFVEENAEYVGPRFPEEARKIHYGESEKRHIYGEATIAQAKELVEEGIEIAPVPPDPESLN